MNSAHNNLTEADLLKLTDDQLQHLLDCQADADLMGNAWGKALIAEEKRRKSLRILGNAVADACIANLGDRGAQNDDFDLFSETVLGIKL
jgi:hypothetical protein